MLNGKSFNQYQMVIGSPEQARGIVRTLKFIGMDALSLERRVPRDSYFSLMEEAKHEGIPVGGHIPIGVKPEEASDAGQVTIENADTLFEGMVLAGIPEEKISAAIAQFLASGTADALFARFVKNHTAYTPAISQFEWSLQDADPSAPKDPRKRYVVARLLLDATSSCPRRFESYAEDVPRAREGCRANESRWCPVTGRH